MFSQFDSVDPESDHHWNEKVDNQILPAFRKGFQRTLIIKDRRFPGEKSLEDIRQKWGWKINTSGIQVQGKVLDNEMDDGENYDHNRRH